MAPKSGPQSVPGYTTRTGKVVRPYSRAPKQTNNFLPMPGMVGNHTPQPMPMPQNRSKGRKK